MSFWKSLKDNAVRNRLDDEAFHASAMREINQGIRCRIPDDHIDPRRFPLFMARSAMRGVIDELRRERGRC